MSEKSKDQNIIEELGGPAKVAEMLGFEKQGGVQRVQNWIYRGIPSKVKVDHQEIFLQIPRKVDRRRQGDA